MRITNPEKILKSRFTYQPICVSILFLFSGFFVFAQPSDQPRPRPQPGVRVGMPCPEMALQLWNGKTKKLSEYVGNTILIHFWTFESDTCLKVIPELIKMKKKYGKFEVISINDGKSGEDSLKSFVLHQKINFPVAVDRNDFLYKKFVHEQIFSLPFFVLIDKQGVVLQLNPTIEEVVAFQEKNKLQHKLKKK
jgi:peroxiredoxin